MAPSPTGFLHVGGVRTFLFNYLFARGRGGECLLRIENTDTSREVAEAVEQIQESLRWMGIDWDGPVAFQLDCMEAAAAAARRLVDEDKAYLDEGAIRIRMPKDGVTAWDDAIKGRIEFPNSELDDMVIVRSDGRPVYNFANPFEDLQDGITHVIRGDDHVSNTPKQLNVIAALGGTAPVYAHVPNVFGTDGKKLSKRHGAVSVTEFREAGYLPEAMMNFLALLGWSFDDKTTLMSRDELVERFTLERVGVSAATFDYDKLDWMNGVYLRALEPAAYADRLVTFLHGEEGRTAWPSPLIRASAPLVQEKIGHLNEYAGYAGFLFDAVEPPAELLAGGAPILGAVRDGLAVLEPFGRDGVEAALRAAAEGLGLKPRDAFTHVRLAISGSKVSPGLFESIELLGREESLRRLDAAAALAAGA
jgi:glutamyl-tRNA synthetase